MTGTCKDCKHWGDQLRMFGQGDPIENVRQCDSERILDISQDLGAARTAEPDAALVKGVDHWAGATFWTGPEFGCVHFAAKGA
jgi:hypothetical protein